MPVITQRMTAVLATAGAVLGKWGLTNRPDADLNNITPGRRVAGSPGRRVAGSPGRRVAGSPGRRVAGSPGRRVAGSPGRRVAGSPGRRVAGSPGRRVAGSPHLRACFGMSALAWLRRPCRPSSPPESSRSAGRRPDARRPASSSDSLDLPAARAAAGVRHAALRLRPVLAAALLALPLSAALAPAALAQSQPTFTINMTSSADEDDGSLSCVVGRSGTQASSLPVNLRISQTGDFLASGGTGDKTFTKGTSLGSSVYVISFDDDDVDEPNGSATCTLLSGTGYTVGTPNSDTTTIVDDDPTIASLIATSDVTFTEQRPSDTAAVTVRLSRRLYAGEQLAVPIDYVGAEGIDAHDESDRDYALSVSGNGATGANLTSDVFYVQFTGHDTDIVQEATVTLTPTNNGDADTDDGFLTLGISAVTADWTDSSFTNVGGGGERHGTERSVRLTYRDDDITLTLSIPDDLAIEDDANNVAQIRVALSRALVSGETVTVPLNFAGASRPADFSLFLASTFTGVSLSGSTVTFTGPSVAAATMEVQAAPDNTDDDETLTVSLGTVTSTGVTVNRETTVNSQIRLLETAPYTPSPGPPLVIVDSITPIGGSCTGRECETTEVPAGIDIIINARLVRPALEKGVGFIPVAATRQIAVNAYLQPGVHAHQWLTPLTFAVGEKSKVALLRMSSSTLVESDVRRMLMFSGPVGSWGEGNPPPFGVVTNDPYWITIKDGPDGNAGTITPIVTVWHTHWQKLDGLYEGEAAGFEVMSASAAQVPFEVYLKVEETAGQCVNDALERTHRVSFAPGVPAVAFSVPTVDDSTGEQDCTVKVSLARADGTVPGAGTTTPVLTGGRGGYIIDKTNDARLGGARTHRADATATVRDDESVARKVFFVTGTRQVRESTAGTVNLEVAVEPAPGAPFELRFSLSGSATQGADYTVPATVTVPMGATRATIPVKIVDDSHEDSGELVTVRLLASGGYAVLPPRHVSLLILNHDPDSGAPDWTDHRTVVNFLVQVRDNPANAAMKGNAAHIAKWNRVLAAIGHASPEQPMATSEIHANAAKWPDSPFKAASVYLMSLERQDPQEPEITVSAGSAVTEGGDAAFTLTATPAPAADLAVSVTVASDGDWGVTAGSRTVTIPASGSATLTLATTDDATDEPDGSVSVTVTDGTGYTVGSSASGTVSVQDDDDAAPPVAAVDPALVAEVRAMAAQTQHGAAHVKRWRRVLVAFGVEEYPGLTPTTLAEAKANAQKYSSPLWPRIADALEKRKTALAQQDPDQPPPQEPEITVSAGSAVTEGGDAVFTLTATPAPAADLAVSVTVATQGDYGITAGTQPVTLPTTGRATLTLATTDDEADEPDGAVTVTVAAGPGYTVGAAASGTVAVRDDDLPPPVVTVSAGASIPEGGTAAFTLTTDRAPAADLAVTLTVTEAADGDFVAAAAEGTHTVTILADTTAAAFTVATTDDATVEPDGAVTATVEAGNGYTVGAPASASVTVTDDDAAAASVLSVADATAKEGARLPMMPFIVRLSAPAPGPVQVHVSTRPSTPVSAQPGQDYAPGSYDLTFRVGETEKTVWIWLYDDLHDDGGETFEVVLSHARGAPIGDGVAVGTIENADPLPAAFLARFGRTLAQQTLTGLTGRLTAPRTPGLQGTLAGQTFQVEPAEGRAATPTGLLTQVLAGVAQGFGGQPGSGELPGPLADDPRRGALQGSPRLLTPRQVLLGSRFTLTSQPDAGGGSFGFWGRAAQGYFDGAERGDGTALTLDGAVTTGFLGADYARGPWLLGVALTHSRATGSYAALGGPAPCPLPDQTVCDGAVRAGTGDTETTLTAAIPYAALEVAERLQLWGAGGYGAGDVTLKTMGARYEADTTWAMAAAGLRGALLPPTAGAAGPDLAVTSDAFWTRTASDRTRDLAASASQVTRLRLGLAGSWRMAVGTPPADARSGASLTPKLELGARQDGGDAETGLGVEIGGGVAWVEPALGLSLDLAGRTLLAHENDDLRDRGFSAALAFDPTPGTPRGPSLSLRQDVGSPATGGLDALFTAAPLATRTGQAAPSRWGLEAAYGVPVFGGHFTGSPHLGVGLAPRIRDYRLGWRLTPDATSALALSLDLAATRQERDAAAPVHTVGVEVLAQW